LVQQHDHTSPFLGLMSPLEKHFIALMKYNRWANDVVCKSALCLQTQQIRQNVCLPLGSIFGTLCHIWLAEQLWLKRFNSAHNLAIVNGHHIEVLKEVSKYWDSRHPDYARYDLLFKSLADVHNSLLISSDQWLQFLETLDGIDVDRVLLYRDTEGKEQTLPYIVALSHIVNHGTHHRGQVSAALSQLGQPYPVLDLPIQKQYWKSS